MGGGPGCGRSASSADGRSYGGEFVDAAVLTHPMVEGRGAFSLRVTGAGCPLNGRRNTCQWFGAATDFQSDVRRTAVKGRELATPGGRPSAPK